MGDVVVGASDLWMSRSRVRFTAVSCRVSTWMGDRLWAGKLSRYVTSHLGQLSINRVRVPACLAGNTAGVFTCAEWQVTLCDYMWQMTPRSSVMTRSGNWGERYRLTF